MSKEEQYEALLAHLSRTGQGAPVQLLKRYPDSYDWSLTEELIKEGKFAIVPAWGSSGTEHLIINDDKYFRAEVDDPNVTTIELMRHYIGIMKEDEIVPIYNVSIKEIIEKNKDSYDEWLNKYKSKLDALLELREEMNKKGLNP
jgi:hypothetical protein